VFNNRFDHTSVGATILRRFGGPHPPHISPRLDAASDLREVLTLAEPRPRSDFARLFEGLPPLVARPPAERSTLPERGAPVGLPDSLKEDFHWLLSAVRLTTGEPPQVSTVVDRCKPQADAVNASQAVVNGINAEIKELQDQLQGGGDDEEPPLRKDFILKEIKRIREQELKPAEAKLKAARDALQFCRDRQG
jgi:hypothetical protein